MLEERFEIAVDGVVLRGHRGGTGAPALLLHGGAAVPDYLAECAGRLDGLFSTIRYTQRGTPPSDEGPPYSVEAHMADALGLVDAFGIDRAWAIGHSWGGHLALHLLVAHPERLLGVLCIDPLGADPSVFAEQDANLRRGLTEEQRARIDEVERRRRTGEVTEAELVERFELIWPQFFAGREPALPPPARIGVEASIGVNRSLVEHFERRTLERSLPEARLPALFVHGDEDPLPVGSTTRTAALVPGALVETIPDCGHFPWVEQPDAFRTAVEALLERAADAQGV
jgi:pimeloyl-ACP methyl ester carboxylesterase